MATPLTNDVDFRRDEPAAGGFATVPRWTRTPVLGTAAHESVIPEYLLPALERLAQEWGVTPHSVLLAAHAKVLGALSGERTVATGYVAVAGGAPSPCRLSTAATSWRTLVRDTHQVASQLPAREGDRADGPGGTPDRSVPSPETVFDPTGGDGTAESAVLRVAVVCRDGRHLLRLRYRTDVLDEACAARIAGYHLTALALIVADPDAAHGRQSLLSAEELHLQLEGLAGPRRALPDHRFHELFERRVRAHPDIVAAVHAGRQCTYQELNTRANRVAHTLLARGLRREDVVAVVTERNLDWLTAVLAVFKAGGAYLPIEPHFPADRMATMLSRASCGLVLTEPGSTAPLDRALESLPGIQRLFIDAACEESGDDSDPGVPVAPDDLAYVIFTSGSTGEPKGAMCEHEGMLNHLYAKIDDLGIAEGQVVAQTAPQCFDISLWQLLCALLAGGRTLLVEQEAVLDVRRFLDTIVGGGVHVLQVVPSYLDVVLSFLEEHPRELRSLRCVSVTGEALKKELVQRWFAAAPRIGLVNAYGLTETCDDTNHEVMDRVPDGERIPLGHPVNNVHVYLVDAYLSPVPLGAPGEIVFSGVCVGRGYVNDPERTRRAFPADPHRAGRRLYRSGDYGRWSPEGKLEFLGRQDAQVKIRGFRIELGEIENALLGVPGIRDGAVVVAPRGGPAQRLVAFYSGPCPLDAAALQEQLSRSLPSYMVPSAFHWRESLPLTANGKTDKKALSALAEEGGTEEDGGTTEESGTRDGRHPPATPVEERLAAAWAKALGIPENRIGGRDNFFDLGGTSLSAVRVAICLDRVVSPKDLLRHPVLADLARLVESRATAGSGPPRAPAEAGRGNTAQGRTTLQDHDTVPGRTTVPDTGRLPAGAERKDTTMASSLPTSLPDLESVPGRTPMLRLDTAADAASWAAEHRDAVRAAVLEHGAVLVRGLELQHPAEVGAVVQRLGLAPVTERESFAPRQTYSEGVYSSSKWPPNQPMCMHHELSYTLEFPGLMLFACLGAPTEGGATGVADSTAVLDALPPELTERFEREGWLLNRSYHDEIGASLPEAFGTDDRSAIESYCRAHAIEYEWQPDGGLRTRQRRSAVVRHPVSGRRCWFNQIAFLNEWTMAPEVREYLIDEYGADGLPFNTRYGDGALLTEDTVQLLNKVYEAHTVRRPWQAGDLLLVDNVRTAHSREPFEGPREVVVAMADPLRLADCSPTVEVTTS
ncbi:amino acid adenylation domain-containing protein [Streptomyces sp. 2112.3]|uniref:amino acid adenylation domain-containing protein n=1 Tax=Streptomyces sp. 2112.3 TaxID=1881023 RepID=UPI000898D2C6|nr:amino acid adenylation domain-containing protein [Streptomyces sp. 2112.3]SED32982.1 amino acid adenylation domain-containing protein [Streptomyces sp. 2112.3]